MRKVENMYREDRLLVKAGTIIKIDGIPMLLTEDVEVIGNKNNIALLEKDDQERVYVVAEEGKDWL